MKQSHKHDPLPLSALYRFASRAATNFASTAELQPLDGVINQERAMQALDFTMQMPQKGYNLYAVGPYGTGKKSLIMRWLQSKTPPFNHAYDWVYVYNFENNNEPLALKIPPRRGAHLKIQIEKLVEDLSYTIPSIFEGDEYRLRYNKLNQEYNEMQEDLFREISAKALEEQVLIRSTDVGFSVIAADENGEPYAAEVIDALDDTERDKIEGKLLKYQEKLQESVNEIPLIERKRRSSFKALEKEVVLHAVDHLISEILIEWQEQSEVAAWVSRMRRAILDDPLVFVPQDEAPDKSSRNMPINDIVNFDDVAPLRRFGINLIVDHSCDEDDDYCNGSPIVYCENPSLANLIGHIEYVPKYGSQLTDFNLIKAGALHQANGGTLVIDADKLLAEPLAWDSLKRALSTGYISFDLVIDQATTTTLVSLSPQKIPLNVKVILLGDRQILSLLSAYDNDFNELFKVVADFDTEIPRNIESEELYGRFIALVTKEEELKPLDNKAVARVIEYGSRMTEDQNKLTAHMASIVDLLREASQLAQNNPLVQAQHIDAAIDGRIFRADKMRSLIQEQINTGVLNIETQGYKVGQINGLSVLATDRFAFGQPARITALVWPGKTGVVDIEREVDLGGNLHSKGVMILAAYLASTFAQEFPLSLAASLTFEQSYFGVDGDSASSTEAYSLLSALADVPINQAIAVTGSMDQKGNVQAIGGVNEKIEGFFDICQARGLTGEHGVIIPKMNEQNLMLETRILKAVERGDFRIWSVGHINEGIEILTQMKAGRKLENCTFEPDSINHKVYNRLKQMAQSMQSFK